MAKKRTAPTPTPTEEGDTEVASILLDERNGSARTPAGAKASKRHGGKRRSKKGVARASEAAPLADDMRPKLTNKDTWTSSVGCRSSLSSSRSGSSTRA